MAKTVKTKMTLGKYNNFKLSAVGRSTSRLTGTEVVSFTVALAEVNNQEGNLRLEFTEAEAKRLKDYLNENFKEL